MIDRRLTVNLEPYLLSVLYICCLLQCLHQQESSAKLTNQRVSYAFTSSPFSFHARHILPISKFQHSYSCILPIFYRHQ